MAKRAAVAGGPDTTSTCASSHTELSTSAEMYSSQKRRVAAASIDAELIEFVITP